MKLKEKIYLAAIRRAMQDRFQFKNRNEAFATLWSVCGDAYDAQQS